MLVIEIDKDDAIRFQNILRNAIDLIDGADYNSERTIDGINALISLLSGDGWDDDFDLAEWNPNDGISYESDMSNWDDDDFQGLIKY